MGEIRISYNKFQWGKLKEECRRSGLTLRNLYSQLGIDLRNQFYKGYSINKSALEQLNSITEFDVFSVLGLPQKIHKIKDLVLPTISRELSEFIGIVLGDGYVSSRSIVITLNISEKNYIGYVTKLISKLFNLEGKVYSTPDNAVQIKIFSKKLINYLVSLDMHRGNKVKQQVGVPHRFDKFRTSVIKGLFDTDGSIYLKEKKYVNLSFTSYSKPLLQYFYEFCKDNKIRSTLKQRDVLIQSKNGVEKFLNLVKPFKARYL